MYWCVFTVHIRGNNSKFEERWSSLCLSVDATLRRFIKMDWYAQKLQFVGSPLKTHKTGQYICSIRYAVQRCAFVCFSHFLLILAIGSVAARSNIFIVSLILASESRDFFVFIVLGSPSVCVIKFSENWPLARPHSLRIIHWQCLAVRHTSIAKMMAKLIGCIAKKKKCTSFGWRTECKLR